MEFEISRQNERIGSFEELFYKQEKMIEEFNENCKKLNKKEDDNLTKIQKTLNESTKEIKNAVDKVRSAMETNQAKVLEKIKKNSAPQPSMNKKLSEEAKRNNEQFMRNIEIKINGMHTVFETYLTEIKNYYEEKLHENIDDLKTLIDSSNSPLRAMISSQKVNELKTGLYRNYTGAAQQNEPNTFESKRSGLFSRPQSVLSISNLNPNYEWRNNNPSSYQNSAWSSAQRSVHTPLADIINRNNKISPAERNLKGKYESPFMVEKADKSPYPSPPKRKLPRACKQNYSQRYTQMNFQRKISTPILKTKQLMKKNLKKSADMDTSFSGNKVNDSKTPPMRSRQRRVNTTRAETIMSSPYLTLYEATMAKEFTFI
ncbi:hypothetical protein AVEN_59735-1 [Araneus ventricosus]|uniref:Uncharacterized protein n=1 Tax=Araneus ventricosus TaxID=182803 RepID=A0A4Y2BMT3_ARAVE|nr:hypothetical protein AVEN_59735-1 [Araneus ventricosus]